MKIKRILAGVLAATITVSSMANSAFADCLKKVDGHPGLKSGDGMWLVQVYNIGNPEEDTPYTDYGIDLSKVTGVSFTLKIVEDLEFFQGDIGGQITLSCSGGDIKEETELWSKYWWPGGGFWGILDPELDIYTRDDSRPVIAEKIDSYTYRYTYNGFANPFVEDGVQSIDCMQVAFQEWGCDLCVAEITECNILDKDGNVLLSFDGMGYLKENQGSDSDDPVESDPDESQPVEPDEPQIKASSSNEGESTVKLEAQFDANVGGIGEWVALPTTTFSADGSEVTVTYDFSDYGKVKFADNFVALSTSLPWDYDENPDLYNENNVKLLSIKMDGEEVGDTSLLCLSNEADGGRSLRITLLNQWGLNFKDATPLYGYTDKEFSVFEVTFSVDNPDKGDIDHSETSDYTYGNL